MALELFIIVRVGDSYHLAGFFREPAKRHTDQSRAVPVSPADVGRSFLVRYKTQVGCWNSVSKSSNACCNVKNAGYCSFCSVANSAVLDHNTLSVLQELHGLRNQGICQAGYFHKFY